MSTNMLAGAIVTVVIRRLNMHYDPQEYHSLCVGGIWRAAYSLQTASVRFCALLAGATVADTQYPALSTSSCNVLRHNETVPR